MTDSRTNGPSTRGPGAARRREIILSQNDLVQTACLQPEQTLPLVMRPAVEKVDLAAWAAGNREIIESHVLKHGAVLFRGFDIRTAGEFERVVAAISGDLMEYRERSSPRSHVNGRVYTSTDYTADQSIFPHNELSYSQTFPLRLFFFCVTAAREGGETPLGDTRKIFRRIDPEIRDRFMKKKWIYARNLGEGVGLPWETVYQTTDRSAVEEYCRAAGIEFEWREGNRLRTRQVCEPVARHPRTGETVWFNHATFFHVSTLPLEVRDGLLTEFEEEDLPNNTYYGDGSPIEPWVLDELRRSYEDEMVAFAWQEGDIVMLDNMLTAHARMPFKGPRTVLFAMADPIRRKDI